MQTLVSRSISNGSILCLFSILISGCGPSGYLLQAARGQLELMNKQVTVEEAIRSPLTSARIKKLLLQVDPIKKFGEQKGLKPTPNYQTYVQLDRPVVVYVVSASKKLKFESKTWKFPIVGEMPYLGYFSKESAQEYSRVLAEEDLDSDVRGAAAYSTLGWFKDPLLSTMIEDQGTALGDLAELLLHESTHATFYIKDQTTFNENLAQFVGETLGVEYLNQVGTLETKSVLTAMDHHRQRGVQIRNELFTAYRILNEIYLSAQSDEEKTRKKVEIFSNLENKLGLKRSINNATLIEYRNYHAASTGFLKVFDSCNKAWDCFWKKIRQIDEKSFEKSGQEDLDMIFKKIL